MGIIEELPDDFDESLNLNEPQPTEATGGKKKNGHDDQTASFLANHAPFPIKEDKVKGSDPMAPDLPPAMASIRSYTPEQLAGMLNQTPLFMTDMENAGDEGEISRVKLCFLSSG